MQEDGNHSEKGDQTKVQGIGQTKSSKTSTEVEKGKST
jgi:hypothetical protein